MLTNSATPRRFSMLLFLAAGAAVAVPAAAQDSTVLGVTAKPNAGDGAPVSATATGSGFCGAVHIDWGDGTAITYATSTLPVTQTHVYKYGGTYTVRAQGMGNCAGQATTRVRVAGPEPPPPPPPAPPTPPAAAAAKLTAVDLSAPSIAPRSAVNVTLRGEGSCRVDIDFGDGNSQELSGGLPLSVRHTYSLAGTYVIAATPRPPCAAKQTATLTVGAAPPGPRITGVDVSTPPGVGAGVRAIRIDGSGPCAYTLDFGDGNSEGRNAVLPDVVRHNYPAGGRYVIVATPAPPCAGAGRSVIVIGDSGAGVLSRLEVASDAARIGTAIAITVAGSGRCRVTIDFGDDQQREVTANLPTRITHRYASAGDYEILAWTDAPCTGSASADVRVRRR
jgi:hypothetical protein